MKKKSSGYSAFLAAKETPPSPTILHQLHSRIEPDLNPTLLKVGLKVAGLHLLGALFSLAICPQFGIGPFGGDAGLMSFLTPWGWAACASGCGAAFMVGTGLLSAWILNPDEKRTLDRTSGWIFTALAAVSWGIFMMTGEAQVHSEPHHAVESLSKETFSSAWNFLWAVAATSSAWLAYLLPRLSLPRLSRS